MAGKKGVPIPRYEESFKLGAIKLVVEGGRSPKEVATELGVHVDTIKSWLKNSGYSTRVHRLIKNYNIHSVRYKSSIKHRYIGHNLPIKDNLLEQKFNIKVPNTVWVGDIAYLRTLEGWLYLAIVKDLCTKQIVGYAMSDKIDTKLAISALDMAVRKFKPNSNLTFHSDRGSQYAALNYQEKLKFHGIKGSMSRSGNPYDNAVAESFFSSLKCELVHLTTFYTKVQAELEVFNYVEKYNHIRPHSSIGWMSPNEFARNSQSISA